MDDEDEPAAYRRGAFTWSAFRMLAGFGFLNAVLGPTLPFLRADEHISYVVGALHQAGFAVGGGVAGALAASAHRPGRRVAIGAGLPLAAAALLLLGYGSVAPVTIAAAVLVSLFGTSALISLWAALADVHGQSRAVAMTEGEVAVSAGSVVAPLAVAIAAASALGWRFAFAVGALVVLGCVAASARVPVPPARDAPPETAGRFADRRSWRHATLVIVVAIVGLEFALNFWLASYLHEDVGLGRAAAAVAVSALYAANLAGRLVAAFLARSVAPANLLAIALACSLAGLPLLLAAHSAVVAVAGIVITGAGIGAQFPVTSALHVAATSRTSDYAVGQVLLVAAAGQITGPLVVGAIAQAADLRMGLLTVPALAALACVALAVHRRATAAGPP